MWSGCVLVSCHHRFSLSRLHFMSFCLGQGEWDQIGERFGLTDDSEGLNKNWFWGCVYIPHVTTWAVLAQPTSLAQVLVFCLSVPPIASSHLVSSSLTCLASSYLHFCWQNRLTYLPFFSYVVVIIMLWFWRVISYYSWSVLFCQSFSVLQGQESCPQLWDPLLKLYKIKGTV